MIAKFKIDIPPEYIEREVAFVIPGKPQQKRSPQLATATGKDGKAFAVARKATSNIITAHEIKQLYIGQCGGEALKIPPPHQMGR